MSHQQTRASPRIQLPVTGAHSASPLQLMQRQLITLYDFLHLIGNRLPKILRCGLYRLPLPALAKGDKAETNGTTEDSEGKREVPSILLTPQSITKDNVKDLRAMAKQKAPAGKIAKKLKRTEGAVRQKAFSLGLSLDSRG